MAVTSTSAIAAARLSAGNRSGLSYWLRSYVMMLRWDLVSLRMWLPMFVVVQVLTGAGMGIIYGLYYPEVSPVVALWIATGAPALALIPIGFLMVPSGVGMQKIAQTYDFTWSLPVPRTTAAVSTFTIFTLGAVPGMVAALLVAWWRYGIGLTISPLIAPAVLLVALMATSVGYAQGHATDPRASNLIGNLVMFFVLLFSPIVYPIQQLPDWLAKIHLGLPFYHMSVVIRDGLSEGLVTDVGNSYLVLAAWTIAAWAVAAWIVGRRG